MTFDCQTLCQNNDDDKDTDSREEIKGIKENQTRNRSLLIYYYYFISTVLFLSERGKRKTINNKAEKWS